MGVDLSKAPEGATHYVSRGMLTFYRFKDGEWFFHVQGSPEWHKSVSDSFWLEENLNPIADQWPIYNNDKPLSELTDSQAAELFNWWRNGGEVEWLECGTKWSQSKPVWSLAVVYRAKQKSERELFVDAFRHVVDRAKPENDDELASALFAAGFKAPKLGE